MELSQTAQTCDILLTSGNGVVSNLIKNYSKAQMIRKLLRDSNINKSDILEIIRNDESLELSHLALLIKISDEELYNYSKLKKYFKCGSGFYVFESTTGNVDWSGISGVQINPFFDWLHNYDGRVGERHFDIPPIHSELNISIINDMISMLGMDYENGVKGLFELMMTFNDDISIDTPEPHCTEAGVIIMKNNGFCKPETNEHKLPPDHFGNGREFETQFADHELNKIIWLK